MKWAEVDVGALRRNTAALVDLVGPGVEVMAMVKANGYGHGALLTARAVLAGGARRLGVSSAEEALQLRNGGIDAPVLVVGWTHPSTHPLLVAAGIEATVFDAPSVGSLAAAARAAGRPARCHLKVDTGMNRVGALPEAVPALLDELRGAGAHIEVAGVFTHFADADGADAGFTERQEAAFAPVVERVRAAFPGVHVHAANSAATLRFPETRHDLVRPGLVLYGYLPAGCGASIEVEPAMSVVAWVTHTATVRQGETVGYGRTWTAARDTRVAVVAAGYADGVQRSQSNRGGVVIRDARCPILGRVSMDQVTVDVSAVAGVRPGDRAVLLGRGRGADRLVDADAVAMSGATSPYEVLCMVSARVMRRVVDEPSAPGG